MAKFIPITISGSGGQYKVMNTTQEIIDVRFLSLSASVTASGTYQTNYPDIYYFTTASVDTTNAGTTTQVEVMTFTAPVIKEKSYFLTRGIIGGRTATAAQTFRIGLTVPAVGDGISALEHPDSLSTLQYRYYGSADTLGENTTATTTGAANTNYPAHIYALTQGGNTADITNRVVLVAEAGATVNAESTTSHLMNEFFAISSSIEPNNSVTTALSLTGSAAGVPKIKAIGTGDTIDDSALTPTASLWVSQSVAVALSTTSATVYTTIFTLTGLTDGARYLVNLYLIGRSSATGTNVHMQVANANNHNGTLWVPNAATSYVIVNSADGTTIAATPNAGWPVANADYLIRGEYTFTKAVGSNPTIAFRSETAGQTATIQANSLVLYRRIDQNNNKVLQTPLTLSSGFITAHTEKETGNLLKINNTVYPTLGANIWRRLTKTTVTSSTSATAAALTDLQITLVNSRKYLVVCYLGVSSVQSTIGARISVISANATVHYTIESPTSTTGVSITHSAANNTINSPASSVTNYYLYKIWALVITNAAGTPTFAPALATETANNEVRVGDSLLYYVEY